MKKMKKSKLKGMTLAEIVVSMAIFTISATILVTGAISVYRMIRNTRTLNRKLSYQTPIADKMVPSTPTVTEIRANNTINSINIKLPNGGGSYDMGINGVEVVPEDENQPAGNLKYFN